VEVTPGNTKLSIFLALLDEFGQAGLPGMDVPTGNNFFRQTSFHA
jgi:hypothetical protein